MHTHVGITGKMINIFFTTDLTRQSMIKEHLRSMVMSKLLNAMNNTTSLLIGGLVIFNPTYITVMKDT